MKLKRINFDKGNKLLSKLYSGLNNLLLVGKISDFSLTEVVMIVQNIFKT